MDGSYYVRKAKRPVDDTYRRRGPWMIPAGGEARGYTYRRRGPWMIPAGGEARG